MNRSSGLLLLICFTCAGITFAAEPSRLDLQPEVKTLTIQEAIRMSLAHSLDVSIAEAQATRAMEVLREIRSLNRPQVVTGTGLAYNNGFPLSIEGAAPSLIQLGVSQAIFSKKNRNLIREAEEVSKASQLTPESVRNELASRTALIYYELHQAQRIGTLWFAQLGAAQKQQQLLETLLEAGRASPLDLTLSKTATSSAEQQILVAREQAKIAEAELRELTGLSSKASIQTIEPQIESRIFELTEDTLYQHALEVTPEIRQAEAEVRAKEFHIEAERGERWPQLDIISQYALFSRTNNYQDYFNRFTRNNFIIGLSIQVPIFDGNRTNAKVAQSRQEALEAHHRLQRLKSDLKLNILRDLSALRIARGASELARDEVAAARESFQVSETLWEAGRIGHTELENSRYQMHQQNLVQLEADKVLFQRKIELLRITGEISSNLQ